MKRLLHYMNLALGACDRFINDVLQLATAAALLGVKAGLAFLLFKLAMSQGYIDQFLAQM